MEVIIDESKIDYGLEDGWLGMFTHPCPGGCGGSIRDWGTSGDFAGGSWMIWKCTQCRDMEGESPVLFEEPIPPDEGVVSGRYRRQRAALAFTRGHAGIFP